MQLQGDLFQGGIPAQFSQQPLVHGPVVFQSRPHFLAHAVAAGLHGHRLCHVEADPAVPVGGIAAVAVIADGLPQAQAAFLDQVQQQHTVANVLPCQLNHPAQTQVGQLCHSFLVTLGAALCQHFIIALGGKACHLFQIHIQGICRVQKFGIQPLLHQLHLLPQPQGGFANGTGTGQLGNAQVHTGSFQVVQGILHRLLVCILQHGQKIGSGNGVAHLLCQQESLPGALFKGKIQFIH